MGDWRYLSESWGGEGVFRLWCLAAAEIPRVYAENFANLSLNCLGNWKLGFE